MTTSTRAWEARFSTPKRKHERHDEHTSNEAQQTAAGDEAAKRKQPPPTFPSPFSSVKTKQCIRHVLRLPPAELVSSTHTPPCSPGMQHTYAHDDARLGLHIVDAKPAPFNRPGLTAVSLVIHLVSTSILHAITIINLPNGPSRLITLSNALMLRNHTPRLLMFHPQPRPHSITLQISTNVLDCRVAALCSYIHIGTSVSY